MIIENGSTPRVVFLLVDETDDESAETGQSPTVEISKNGGTFAAVTNSVSEIGNGWYYVALTATETNTDGPLIIRAVGTGTDEWRDVHEVKTSLPISAAAIRAALGLASANLDTQLAALPTAAENRSEMDSNSTQLSAIVADTNELQGDQAQVRYRLQIDGAQTPPAADTPAQLPVDVQAVDGDTAAAANLESDYDGTGYNKSNSTIGTVSNVGDKSGYALSGAGVDAILDEAITEPSGTFSWGSATLRNIIAWLGALSRNKITQTASAQTLRNDADTSDIATAAVSDSSGTATRGEWS